MALFSLKKLYRRREAFTTLFFQSDGFGLFLWRKSARQGGLAFDSAGKKQKIKPFQSATFCSKRAISSVRRYTVSSVSPVIITSHVLTRNRYLISRTPLTCSGMTGNHTGLQGISLYFTASQKGEFDNREQIKARREVDNVVEGNYDQQQKRGFSMRR